jgi:hypothetical protein
MLGGCGEVREFGLTGLTRNQVSLTAPGVRIPPSPPSSLACFPTLWRSDEIGAWGAIHARCAEEAGVSVYRGARLLSCRPDDSGIIRKFEAHSRTDSHFVGCARTYRSPSDVIPAQSVIQADSAVVPARPYQLRRTARHLPRSTVSRP